MNSKYIRFIDLGEICAAIPSHRSSSSVKAEHLLSVPRKIADSVLESFHGFINHPDLHLFGDVPEKVRPEKLAALLDEVLATVWESKPNVSHKQRLLSRDKKGLPPPPGRCNYHQLIGRICSEGPALEALLIYQMDGLCGAQRAGDLDEVMALIPDLLAIQRDIGERNGRQFSSDMLDISNSYEARQRAELRHKPTNKQKAAALAEWDAHGANVSSMAAFARARHRDFGVTERTLGTWIREHRKGTP